MTSRDESSPTAAPAASPEAVAAYRTMVARLVERCIQRVREWPVADDTEPLPQWRPRRD